MEHKTKDKLKKTIEEFSDSFNPSDKTDPNAKMMDAMADIAEVLVSDERNEVEMEKVKAQREEIESQERIEMAKIEADKEKALADIKSKNIATAANAAITVGSMGLGGLLLGAILKFEETGTVRSKILQPVLRMITKTF